MKKIRQREEEKENCDICARSAAFTSQWF